MIKTIKIGEIDNGIDGCDVFYKVYDTEDNLTVTEAEDYIYKRYSHFMEPSNIGGKYVDCVRGTKLRDYIHNEVIVEIAWRYDV